MLVETAGESASTPETKVRRGRGARRLGGGPWIDVLIGAIVVVIVAGPVLFTRRPFQVDTTNSMWLASVMAHSMPHGLPPTFFLNTNNAGYSEIFNPLFAFYGGPLFALFGLLVNVLGGSVPAAFDVLMVLAFAAAYGGMAWLSRQCGLRGRLVHVPALVVVSAAYYLTDLYGRGDVAEFVALSVIPLVVASVVHLVRAKSWTPGPTVLLVVSVVCFTGSHNITLLWATLIGIVTLVVLFAVLRPRPFPFRRLVAVAGLVLLATVVNAWFLLPDVAFSASTKGAAPARIYYTFFDGFGILFHLGRVVPSQSSSPALFVQTPVWFLLWCAACGVCIWRMRSLAFLRKAWTAVALLFAALVGLIMATPIWSRLPTTLREIQFPYRLNGYVVLLAAGLVLVCMLALQHEWDRARKSAVVMVMLASLAAVSAVSIVLALWQEWVPKSCPTDPSGLVCVADRSSGLTPTDVLPSTWYAGDFYADASEPVPFVAPDRMFVFSPAEVDAHGDRLVATVIPPPGTAPFATNILAGPNLVSIGGGIERVGRTQNGYAVVRRVEPGDGQVQAVIQTADGPAIWVGRWLSATAAIAILLLLAGQVFRGRNRRGRRGVGRSEPA